MAFGTYDPTGAAGNACPQPTELLASPLMRSDYHSLIFKQLSELGDVACKPFYDEFNVASGGLPANACKFADIDKAFTSNGVFVYPMQVNG